MATQTNCTVCVKKKGSFACTGCSQYYCIKHLNEHEGNFQEHLSRLEIQHDELRDSNKDLGESSWKHSLMTEIEQWEMTSIDRIKQVANQCKESLNKYMKTSFHVSNAKLDSLAEWMKKLRQDNDFNELDLNAIEQKLNQVRKDMTQLSNFVLERQPSSFINLISLRMKSDAHCKQVGVTVAGGKGYGNRLDQLSSPFGIYVDQFDQTIYIADCYNARIIEKRFNVDEGRIVAGGKQPGNEINQLNEPTDVVIDYDDNSFIITDQGNRRVIRQSRHCSSDIQIIISDIDCSRLAMHKDGTLYVSDCVKNEVRRWKKGEKDGMIVAGGKGQGNQINQLNYPTYLFVDDNHNLYISDTKNHRVVKWLAGAKEGIVVAGGNGGGQSVTQLLFPQGVKVDLFGRIFVADYKNDRVMQWCEGANEGTIVLDGKSKTGATPLFSPVSLAFDNRGNLYIADYENLRIQIFEMDGNLHEIDEHQF